MPRKPQPDHVNAPTVRCIAAEDIARCLRALRAARFEPGSEEQRERIELYLWYLFQLRGCRPTRTRPRALTSVFAQIYGGLLTRGVSTTIAKSRVAHWHQECVAAYQESESGKVDWDSKHGRRLSAKVRALCIPEALTLGVLGEHVPPADEDAIQQAYKRWRNATVHKQAQIAIEAIVDSLAPAAPK